MRRLLSLILLLPLAACGAGLVAGLSNSGSDPSNPQPAPTLSIPDARIPLVPAQQTGTTFRTVVVGNAQIQPSALLQVQVRALGIEVDQSSPVIVSGQGGSTVVGFVLRTEPFVAAAGDPTIADVPGLLAVKVNGVDIAPPAAIVLLRQPSAALVLEPGEDRQLLSPLGRSVVRLQVTGLRSTRVEDLKILVVMPAVATPSVPITRPCLDLAIEPGPAGTQVVRGEAPANEFPGLARIVVEDAVAGRSTVVEDAYYRPDVAVALPARGPTTGGSLVTLIGSALVPLDFTSEPARPDFDKVALRLRKGGREVQLDPRDLRTAESGLDRLVFTMPFSPDGRPGQVDIVLRVQLGTVEVDVTAADVFLFANPQPVFGPRGAVLDREVLAATTIGLEAVSQGGAPDLALLSEQGGAGSLQLLAAEENGMFIRFGPPSAIGDPQAAAERGPVQICAADFDGDLVPDLRATNQGAALAVDQLVLGQQAPLAPLGSVLRTASLVGAVQSVPADFDRDGILDVLLAPGPSSPAPQLPRLQLSRPTAPGAPAFVDGGTVPVRAGAVDHVSVADLDGDQFLDVLVLRAGAVPRVDIAYGTGSGAFIAGPRIDLVVPDFTPDVAALGIGVHACGNQFPRSIAVVVGGVPTSSTTPSILAVLRPGGARSYRQPIATDVVYVQGLQFRHSLAADLDVDGVVELAVSIAGDTAAVPLGLFGWNVTAQNFQPIFDGIESGSEQLLSIGGLWFGVAFPADPVAGRSEVRAVFVLHESAVDGFRERRISTLLVGPGPKLLAPDAGGQVPIPVRSLVGGSFTSPRVGLRGATLDLALGGTGEVRLLRNDGAGGFFGPGPVLAEPALLPGTLTAVQITPEYAGVDALAFLRSDGALSIWTQAPVNSLRTSADLRAFAPEPLRSATVAATSRIRNADLDGDGIRDLVVLVTFDLQDPGDGDALLLVLRGKATYATNEFPFHLPSAATAVGRTHGGATDIAVADFRVQPDSSVLEVAVAVPVSGPAGDDNHVRFHRLQRGIVPSLDVLVRSSTSAGPAALVAGTGPTRLGAGDFDGDGSVDLLVAAQGDATLRLFRNDGSGAADPGEVDIAAFRQSLGSPLPTAVGAIRALLLGDINGDANVDALVAVESLAAGVKSSSVAFYLSSGTGELAGPSFVSPTRLGDRDSSIVLDLGDFNGDGVPDLPVAWATAQTGDRNVRVLFGGSR